VEAGDGGSGRVGRERVHCGGGVVSVVCRGCEVNERISTVGRVVFAGCDAKERTITGGRVAVPGCEAVEGKITLSGVEAGIASVWCRGNRLRRRRKRKPCEGEGEADEKETEPQRRVAD